MQMQHPLQITLSYKTYKTRVRGKDSLYLQSSCVRLRELVANGFANYFADVKCHCKSWTDLQWHCKSAMCSCHANLQWHCKFAMCSCPMNSWSSRLDSKVSNITYHKKYVWLLVLSGWHHCALLAHLTLTNGHCKFATDLQWHCKFAMCSCPTALQICNVLLPHEFFKLSPW